MNSKWHWHLYKVKERERQVHVWKSIPGRENSKCEGATWDHTGNYVDWGVVIESAGHSNPLWWLSLLPWLRCAVTGRFLRVPLTTYVKEGKKRSRCSFQFSLETFSLIATWVLVAKVKEIAVVQVGLNSQILNIRCRE